MIITLKKSGMPAATAIAIAVLALPASATNGYFAHGFGVRSKAMAGATVALPLDALAAAVNPAGMAFIGNRLDMEVELVHPPRQFTVEGTPILAPGTMPLANGTFASDSNWFPIPTFGAAKQLDDRQTVGIAIYNNGGVNTDYVSQANRLCPAGTSGVFCAGTTGVDMAQFFITPSYAYRFGNKRFALGIAPIFAIQRLKVRGLNSLAALSSDPTHLSNQGYDYSYGGGVRVGILAELWPGLRFGASYKSRIFSTRFSDYAGLLNHQGALDVPESFNIGLALAFSPGMNAGFEVEHIRYRGIEALGYPLLPNLIDSRLGSNDGPGLGLKNMTVFKVGWQWQQSPAWTWRAGVSYGRQPLQKSEVLLNLLVPGVQEFHITTGFSYKASPIDDLSFAFYYSPEYAVKGTNSLSPNQTIEIKMYQLGFQCGWTRRF